MCERLDPPAWRKVGRELKKSWPRVGAWHHARMALTTDDRLAIHELIALHGHLVDAGEFGRLGEVFTDDFVYDVSALGFGSLAGAEAFTEASRALGDDNPLGHHVTNTIVVAAGDGEVMVCSKGIGILADGDERNRRLRGLGAAHPCRLADLPPRGHPAQPSTTPLSERISRDSPVWVEARSPVWDSGSPRSGRRPAVSGKPIKERGRDCCAATDPLSVDAGSFLAIVATAAIAGTLSAVIGARWVFVPVVVVELALGVLIGPQLLDLAQVDSFTEFFADLGLGMLFFFAGYEIDIERIRGEPLRLAIVGWALSLAIAYSLGGILAAVGVVVSLVYVGSALATTAIGTLIPVFSDTRRCVQSSAATARGRGGRSRPILLLTLARRRARCRTH